MNEPQIIFCPECFQAKYLTGWRCDYVPVPGHIWEYTCWNCHFTWKTGGRTDVMQYDKRHFKNDHISTWPQVLLQPIYEHPPVFPVYDYRYTFSVNEWCFYIIGDLRESDKGAIAGNKGLIPESVQVWPELGVARMELTRPTAIAKIRQIVDSIHTARLNT